MRNPASLDLLELVLISNLRVILAWLSMANNTNLRLAAIVWQSLIIIGVALLALTACADAAEPPFDLPPKVELGRIRSAVLYTERGSVTFELFIRPPGM